MKPDNQSNNNGNRQLSLDQELAGWLDQSTSNLPASVVSRLRADRSNALDTLESGQSTWRNPFDWRPAIAAAALGALAVVLLYLPNNSTPLDLDDSFYSESWLAEDDYFSGDDLSLYLWLSETGDLDGDVEG